MAQSGVQTNLEEVSERLAEHFCRVFETTGVLACAAAEETI
jgi:hypothetical protein